MDKITGFKIYLKHPENKCIEFPLSYKSENESEWSNDPSEGWQKGFLHLNDGERDYIIPVCNIDWIEWVND